MIEVSDHLDKNADTRLLPVRLLVVIVPPHTARSSSASRNSVKVPPHLLSFLWFGHIFDVIQKAQLDPMAFN